MSDGYLNVVSRVLAGWDPDTAADELSGMLADAVADGAYAEALTVTQITVVAGQAALDYYLANGTTDVYWQTTPGACPLCLANEAASPIRAGDAFPSGDLRPPGHPHCVIGSTRVAVPGAGSVVPGDVAVGLPGDFASPGPHGDRGSLSATAVTKTEGDFGRENIRAVSDREYVGQVITIRTALGHELTATPNHPVATRRGWVPIAELKVGDHVLSSTAREWMAPSVDPDVNDIPPRIENVAQTFPVLFGPVPTAAEDFHGDGAGSDVYVVRADRLLGDDGAPGLAEHVCEHHLRGRGVAMGGAGALDAEGLGGEELGGLRPAPDGIVGGAGEPRSFAGVGLRHPGEHSFAAVPGRHPSLHKSPTDYGAVDAEGFCERLLALSSDVAADEIVHVQRDAVATHVYNLETSSGWYIGNGILTHNCRCGLMPAWLSGS